MGFGEGRAEKEREKSFTLRLLGPLGNWALTQLWLSDTEEVWKFYDKAEKVKIKEFRFFLKETVSLLICLFSELI